jgi:hypothetical protein
MTEHVRELYDGPSLHQNDVYVCAVDGQEWPCRTRLKERLARLIQTLDLLADDKNYEASTRDEIIDLLNERIAELERERDEIHSRLLECCALLEKRLHTANVEAISLRSRLADSVNVSFTCPDLETSCTLGCGPEEVCRRGFSESDGDAPPPDGAAPGDSGDAEAKP